MPRFRPLLLINVLAICVIAAFLFWALRLPAPADHVAQAAHRSEGVRSVAAGVTIASPLYTVPAGAMPPAAPGGAQPTSDNELDVMSTNTDALAASTPDHMIDAGWLARIAARTGIPSRALQAYAAATSEANAAAPACAIGWNTVAAIGLIESGHGTHGGGSLTDSGRTSLPIVGPRLDGNGFASIPDTDGGTLDGDTAWDHAVGPMQFIPSTWLTAGRDGSGDGVADPLNIDDAALSAASYLCANGRNLSTDGGWTEAIMSYNHSSAYASQVRDQANTYAALAGPAG
jgi:membrane-bound lytic murein transglycosylase B